MKLDYPSPFTEKLPKKCLFVFLFYADILFSEQFKC